MPVREALQALNSEGLVMLSPGQGAKVVELEREDIADLYDLRLALEPRLAPDVIDGLSPRDHQRLAELSSLMPDAREHDEMVTAIETRDADALAEQVNAHLDGARQELLDERWWSDGHFAVPPGGAGGGTDTDATQDA